MNRVSRLYGVSVSGFHYGTKLDPNGAINNIDLHNTNDSGYISFNIS